MVEVCRRLDGLPLAIELAAARLDLLHPEGLVALLDDRLALPAGSRIAPPRQQTLRATLDWSYALLDEAERALLRRLSAFAGGWTSEAAAEVCAGDRVPAGAVPNLLARLVGKSLLTVTARQGEPRYSMLETVRQYARERLADGEAAVIGRRHLSYCLRLLERALVAWTGTALPAWLDRLEEEHDNLRSALTWAQTSGETALGIDLATALCPFWELRGYLGEGRRWLDLLLRGADGIPAAVRARALNAAGNLAYRQGDSTQATSLLEAAVTLRRDLGDAHDLAQSLNNLGLVADDRGDYARASALYEESLALKRQRGDRRGAAHSLTNLGRVMHHRGDLARAAALHEESVALLREIGDHQSLARSLTNLAAVTAEQGDHMRTSALLEESLALKWQLGDRQGTAASLDLLSVLAAAQGDHDRAAALREESAAISREVETRNVGRMAIRPYSP